MSPARRVDPPDDLTDEQTEEALAVVGEPTVAEKVRRYDLIARACRVDMHRNRVKREFVDHVAAIVNGEEPEPYSVLAGVLAEGDDA